jgi:hypothetical protein
VGVGADVAMSMFWTLGNNTGGPTGFIRGSFGAELGAGAELSGLLGFAFNKTTNSILGSAVTVDADFIGAGAAVVANINGMTSLEFTLGPGMGFGLVGVAYSITAEIDPAPSTAPSMSPSSAPIASSPTTPAPTPTPGSPTTAPVAASGCVYKVSTAQCRTDADAPFAPGYVFSYDGTNNIGDGGNDMYDGGNELVSSLFNPTTGSAWGSTGSPVIPYTAGVTTNGDAYYGTGSTYVTYADSGIFTLSVRGASGLSYVGVRGNAGADGSGLSSTSDLLVNGNRVFVKQIYAAFDPSIIHIWILQGASASASQEIPLATTNSDGDQIQPERRTRGACVEF